MVISKFLKTQSLNKHNELVEKLRREARVLFYDKMMYEINDALASILAVCDVEGREGVPKIKQYIHRINQSLNNTKNYQNNFNSEKRFNISAVIDNLIKVVKENYKDTKLACLISDIKAPVSGDQTKFELLFLHIFVSILKQNKSHESEILIELRQKNQDAMITILRDSHTFQDGELELINSIKEDESFIGEVKITPQGKGVEIIIKIPLQFKVVNITGPIIKKVRASSQKFKKKVIVAEKVSTRSENEVAIPGFAF